MKPIIITLMLLTCLTSCSVKIADFEKYTKAPLLELEEMPTKEEIALKMPRVIIITEKSEGNDVEQLNAQTLIKNNLLTELQTKKYANIVERIDAGSIQKELKIAELEGKASSSITSVDYIINVSVPTVTFSKENTQETNFVSTPKGLVPVGTASYTYTSIVDGILKVYEVPSLKIAKVVSFKGASVQRERASSNSTMNIGGIAINTGQPLQAKEKDANLTYKAAQTATRNAIQEMKQFFKKKGFISEKRQLGKKVIFSINRGRDDDFLPQRKLSVVRNVEKHNDLTDEDEINEEAICTGTISNKVFERTAWIVFDEKCQDKINLGDKAIMVY